MTQNPTNLPNLAVKNLAPLQPLVDLGEGAITPTYLAEGIKELFDDCLARDKEVWNEIARTSEVVSNFIQGKQLWQPNYWNNTWTPQPVNHANPNKITAINLTQYFATEQIKMFTSSNPDLEPIQEFKRKEYKEKVKIAKATWNYYEPRFYTAWFNNMEALHAIISGTYIESVRFDYLKQGAQVFREIFGEEEIEISAGSGKCYECGQEGIYADFVRTGEEMPSCPNCKSYEIDLPESPVTQSYRTVTGRQPVNMGAMELRVLPIQAVRFDMHLRCEISSWMIHREIINQRQLQYYLGNAHLPMADIFIDEGLRSLQSISHAGNTLSGRNTGFQGDIASSDTVLERFSVSQADIAHIVAGQEEETISGGKIKKGQRFADLCVGGCTIIGINQMGTILGIYPNVHHSQEVATGVYHQRLESGVGRGSEDTVEVQKRFNRFDAQNVKAMETGASPAHTYVEGAIDPQHVKKIGQPGSAIPINQGIAQSLGSQNVVNQIPPTSMPAQFFSYTYDILNQFRQFTSHATFAEGGFPGVDNKTLGGMKLAQSNANSIWTPMLKLKSEVRASIAHHTLKLHNRHFKDVSMYMSFGQTQEGQEVGDFVKGSQIDCDIRFTAIRNSEQPKTDYDRQMDFANMLSLVGGGAGYAQLKQLDPQLITSLQKTFDLDLGDDVYDCLSDVCEERLEEAFEVYRQGMESFEQFQQKAMQLGVEIPPPPIELVLEGLSKPIMLTEPNHLIKAKWYQSYLDTPEGFKLEETMREIVSAFIVRHFQMEVAFQSALQQGFNEAMVAGQAPMREAQAQDAQAQNEQAQAQQQAQMAQQGEMDAQNKANEVAVSQQESEVANQRSNEKAVLDSALRVAEAHLVPPKENSKNAQSKKN